MKINKNIPFIRFDSHDSQNMIVTNLVGDSMIMSNAEFDEYIEGNLDKESKLYKELENGHFFMSDDYEEKMVNLFRLRNAVNYKGPSLHIIILTKGCNHQCRYCHASANKDFNDESLKISKENAKKIIDTILESPSHYLNIEFQGGEPISNLEVIDYIIKYTEQQNKVTKKNIVYSLVSNLTLITEEILEQLFTYPNLNLSTSLDGPKVVHDFNRIITGNKSNSSFDVVMEKIVMIRKREKELKRRILFGAMGVVTSKTLKYPKELVDIYYKAGFNEIFIKKLNNLGYAERQQSVINYSQEDFEKFYDEYLDYILKIFKEEGRFVGDGFLRIIIEKVANPGNISFADLRSPCGAGIAQIAYDHDGNIYTCDEGRMVEEDTFKIGTTDNNLKELIQNETTGITIGASLTEGLPCDICPYVTFCGVCPVNTYNATGNIYYNHFNDDYCRNMKYFFKWIFDGLKDKEGLKYSYIKEYLK